MSDTLRPHLSGLLRERADRTGGGNLDEATPLELVVRGESLSARLYPRYNRTWVLALDVYVDDVDESPALAHWVATRSGTLPFATLHLHRPLGPTGGAVLLVSHTMIAESVDGPQLDEVLDSLTYMARRARFRLEDLSTQPEDAVPADPAAPADSAGNTRVRSVRARSKQEVLEELHGLIGLTSVKTHIDELMAAREVAEHRRRRGLASAAPSPHLVFTGNPGTGKTTVARLVGELYRAIGLLPTGHVVETDRAGLVAGYVGQTALRTAAACEKALGGVLFIDEAYSLLGGERDYGHEAIETLMTFMENHLGEFVLVVAGYPAEMRQFIDSNPGLRSRFDLTIEFPDYRADELETMLHRLATQHDYHFTPEAAAAARQYIRSLPRHRGFGNGREVRKLFNDVVRRHAMLLTAQQPDSQQLCTITVDAVPLPLGGAAPTAAPGYL